MKATTLPSLTEMCGAVVVEENIFPLYVTIAPPAVRSLSNGRTPSSSSEEEEQGLMKNTDSASAKSEDVKSQVGRNNFTCSHTSLLFS